MVKNMIECSPEQFEEAKKDILEMEFHGFKPVKHPKAYLVCGQPGAGKTYLIQHIREKNFAFINGDTFRSFHPAIEELKERLGEGYIEATREFNGKMTEALIEDLSNKKYNLIIEGTMRTTEVPLKTKRLLEAKGYEVSLHVLVVRPEISYLRAKKRYVDMKALGLIPRKTDASFQQNITEGLAKNLETLYKSKEFREICLYKEVNDALTCIYSSKERPTKNPAPLLEEGHKQKYTTSEVNQIKKSFSKMLSEEEWNQLFKGRVQKGLSQKASDCQKEKE